MPLPRTIYAAILAGAALLTPGAALACNPIEALFGACRMDVLRPAYDYRAEQLRARPRADARRFRRSAEAAAARHARAADSNRVSGKQQPLKGTDEAPVGSLALFGEDRTLRNGDIVVTNDGFRVYRGGEFQEIAHDGGKLAQLERVSMRGRPREPERRHLADRRR